jgi:hypothetical protein
MEKKNFILVYVFVTVGTVEKSFEIPIHSTEDHLDVIYPKYVAKILSKYVEFYINQWGYPDLKPKNDYSLTVVVQKQFN